MDRKERLLQYCDSFFEGVIRETGLKKDECTRNIGNRLKHKDIEIAAYLDANSNKDYLIVTYFAKPKVDIQIIRKCFYEALKETDFQCYFVLNNGKKPLEKSEAGSVGSRVERTAELVKCFKKEIEVLDRRRYNIRLGVQESIEESRITVYKGNQESLLHTEEEIQDWVKEVLKEQRFLEEKEKDVVLFIQKSVPEIVFNTNHFIWEKKTIRFRIRSTKMGYHIAFGKKNISGPNLDRLVEKVKETWVAYYEKEKVRAML